ncbi:hypothetical protein [Paenibacillus crassostreae]|uniref:Uncharacterized protein n=1 Tax=Paenibacillus crassostreae TaxID=1763538 RepID=A0A167FIC8_9BACL|nr:hypothetical protein [Paenibacillus crassostreae]AOZ94376.1 hypothetical protein LPB68_20660 [Paenibacillus crassostreae]OAB76587.1 hypothetical protein PNBC_04080 [Paenibacillus crassostreae]
MILTKSRSIAIGTFALTIILFIVDGFLIHSNQWFDGIGIMSTNVIPPIGIVCATVSLKRTGSNKDIVLITINTIALFLFFIYMFFGTLLFGP